MRKDGKQSYVILLKEERENRPMLCLNVVGRSLTWHPLRDGAIIQSAAAGGGWTSNARQAVPALPVLTMHRLVGQIGTGKY